MSELILYLIKTSVGFSVFYIFYLLVLRNMTYFRLNRFYLISMIFISLLLPLLQLPGFSSGAGNMYNYVLETIVIKPDAIQATVSHNPGLFQVLMIIYLTGAGIFLVRSVFRLSQIAWLIYRNGIVRKNGLKLVFTDRNYAPFSFFNVVFLNEGIDRKDIDKIILHEQEHARQRHSVDLLLLELVTAFQWFNPIVWTYANSLKGVHEYLADRGVLTHGINKAVYQELLLTQAIGVRVSGITNSFNQSLLKRRFIMMTKIKSKRFAALRVLMVLPLVFVVAAAFTWRDAQNVVDFDGVVVNNTTENTGMNVIPDGDKQTYKFDAVEKKPEYPGGQQAMITYLSSSIKYPEDARTNGIEGKVYISFVIDKDGKVVDVALKKSVHPLLDAEAERVVKNMPAWSPGEAKGKKVRVAYALPINFVLQ